MELDDLFEQQRLFPDDPQTSAAFQITYFFFYLSLHTAAALTKSIVLHAACVQLGHATLSLGCALNFDPLAHTSGAVCI